MTYFSSDYKYYKAGLEEEYPEIQPEDFIKKSSQDIPSEIDNFDLSVRLKLGRLVNKKNRMMYAEVWSEIASKIMASAFLRPDGKDEFAARWPGTFDQASVGYNLILNTIYRFCEDLEEELEESWPDLKLKDLEDLPKLLDEVPSEMKKSIVVEKLYELWEWYNYKKAVEGHLRRDSKLKEFILLSRKFHFLVNPGSKEGPEKGFKKGPKKGSKKGFKKRKP